MNITQPYMNTIDEKHNLFLRCFFFRMCNFGSETETNLLFDFRIRQSFSCSMLIC